MSLDSERVSGPPGRVRPGLLALCVGVPAAEAAVLTGTGPSAAVALAPQVAAPAPFGAFHDLRWLTVYHSSWWSFALELAALLAFRSGLDALLVHQAWPAALPRPPLPRLVARTAPLTAFSVLALAPWATTLFGLAVAPVSWLFLVAVPPAVAVALLLAPAPAVDRWWSTVPPAAVAWRVIACFGLLTGSGALVSAAPRPAWVPLAAMTGALDALAWRSVVAAALGRPRLRRVPLVGPVACLALVGLVVGGAAAGFGAQAPPGAAVPGGGAGPTAPSGPAPRILVVAGLGTRWDGRAAAPVLGGQASRWFSYRGLGPDDLPLPYGPADTLAALPRLEAEMARQVGALHAAAGGPVTVVAVSEGALVAQAYAAGAVRPPLRRLVLVNPVLDPGRVYYPPPGTPGWGVAGGWALGVLGDALRAVSSIDVAPTTPLFRSIADAGPRLRAVLDRPVPGVAETVLLPLADAVAAPPSGELPGPAVVSLGFHNGALGDPGTRALVGAVVDGRLPGRPGLGLAETVVRHLAAAWQVPALAPSLNPVWRGGRSGSGGQ